MEPLPPTPDLSNALKKLLYRSWYRGNREMDNVLGAYAQTRLPNMGESEIESYRAFLEENDIDLWNWVSGQYPAPPEYAALIDDLRTFQQSRFEV